MRRMVPVVFISLLMLADLDAANLPGFGVRFVGKTADFCNSLEFDSHGILYYTTVTGGIYRLENGVNSKVAQVDTFYVGNSGLLGLALLDDNTAVVHYTQTAGPGFIEPAWEVISKINLTTGAETQLAKLPDNINTPGQGVNSEHHGGIPTIGENGTIWFGIGDFYAFWISDMPEWYAGKVIRIDPDGKVTVVAHGFRNPYGMAWDRKNKRLVVSDNGDMANDEIDIVTSGGDYGWPCTAGTAPPCANRADAITPIYTFPEIVAPTGFKALNGQNSYMRSGFLTTSWVTMKVYYFPDLDVRPVPDPLELLGGEPFSLIDVAVAPNGDIYFSNVLGGIYQLTLPQRGDCNADGTINLADFAALDRELTDGDPHPTIYAQKGSYAGSWGCDANADGVISSFDRAGLSAILNLRARAVRVH